MQITCSIKKCKIVINPSVTFGRVALAFRPAVESLTDSIKVFNPVVNSAVPPTMTEYDILDRTTKVTLPTGDSTRTAYGFGTHDGKTYFQPVTTDPLGTTVRTLTNTIGLTVKQSAPLGAVTTFTYDPIGQLLSSTDPGGLTTTHTYDMLGRRTQRTHPDVGTDRWTYDPAGNMLTHQTQLLYNANKSVNYHYTYSRLDSIVYPDNPRNNVRYTYGDSTAADNANGRVALLEDASGWQSFKYGKMGEVIENNRTFVLPKENSAYSFKMTYEYDNWKIYANRMKRELFLTSAAQYYPSAPLRNRNSSLSIWLSVDPLVGKYPNLSPYTYCAGNPVSLVDEDGKEIGPPWSYIPFMLKHFSIGSDIGIVVKDGINISTVAVRFATRGDILQGTRNIETDKDEGSENGAFRHTLWQAAITSKYGASIAKEAGDAHEANPSVSLTNLCFKELASADQTVDLLNNVIGRRIGYYYKGCGMRQLALYTLDEFHNNGLYTAKYNEDGYWHVNLQQLSDEKYYQLQNIFNQLDDYGY